MSPNYPAEDVERAIEDAIGALKRGRYIPDQIADLADAIDAYHQGTYGIALVLARAAAHPMRATPEHRNLEALQASLDELEARFADFQQRRFAAASPGSAGAPHRHGG